MKKIHQLHIHIEGYGTCSCGKWKYPEFSRVKSDVNEIRQKFQEHKDTAK